MNSIERKLSQIDPHAIRAAERADIVKRLRFRMVAIEDGGGFELPDEIRILLEFAVVETRETGTKEWIAEFQRFRDEWLRQRDRDHMELNRLIAEGEADREEP